jgi:hypothetical protein
VRPKITAEIEKTVTTVENDSGDVTITKKGKFKGFDKGLRDYILKGAMEVKVGATVSVGQFPEGQPDAGQWAIQLIVSPFPEKEFADEMADKLTPIIEGYLESKALKPQ